MIILYCEERVTEIMIIILLIFMIVATIALSWGLPPVLEQLIQGVEQSSVARHPNAAVYSEQLAHIIMHGETVLTDQSVQENGQHRIPLYYGRRSPQEVISPMDRPFSTEPINILRLEIPPEPEKPFDHIVVHKYGFGAVCDKAQEEKVVRAISALAVDYIQRKDPKIAHIFNDTSKDSQFDQPVVEHRVLARGVFCALSNGEIKHEANSHVGINIQRLITNNKCQTYMENLKDLIEGSSYRVKEYVPFDRSPYKGVYESPSLPLTEKMKEVAKTFSWIKQVSSKDGSVSKLKKIVRMSPERTIFFPGKVDVSDSPKSDKEDDSADSTFALPKAAVDDSSRSTARSSNAKLVTESSSENKSSGSEKDSEPTDNKTDDLEDEEIITTDEDVEEDGYEGVPSTEATPKQPIPKALEKFPYSYSDFTDLSSIGGSPVRVEWQYDPNSENR
jgi:hypothetical protein